MRRPRFAEVGAAVERATAPYHGAMAPPEDDPLAALGLTRTLHVTAAPAILGPVAAGAPSWIDPRGGWFEVGLPDGRRLRVHPAVLAPPAAGQRDLVDHLDALPGELGPHAVLLMQAGRSSLGWFEGGAAIETKSFQRYVVRGRGRAQPTHLATKGKSRYGSRLRLQNARALLEETNGRLADWWRERGPAEVVLVNAPKRLLASLFETDPPPPFGPHGPLVRIPRDLPRPTSDLVVRAYRSCCYLRLEVVAAEPDGGR